MPAKLSISPTVFRRMVCAFQVHQWPVGARNPLHWLHRSRSKTWDEQELAIAFDRAPGASDVPHPERDCGTEALFHYLERSLTQALEFSSARLTGPLQGQWIVTARQSPSDTPRTLVRLAYFTQTWILKDQPDFAPECEWALLFCRHQGRLQLTPSGWVLHTAVAPEWAQRAGRQAARSGKACLGLSCAHADCSRARRDVLEHEIKTLFVSLAPWLVRQLPTRSATAQSVANPGSLSSMESPNKVISLSERRMR